MCLSPCCFFNERVTGGYVTRFFENDARRNLGRSDAKTGPFQHRHQKACQKQCVREAEVDGELLHLGESTAVS